MRDGVDESGQLVGKYCGKIAPSPVVSSGNQLFIKFVSDYETHGAGFSIRYEVFKSGKSDTSSSVSFLSVMYDSGTVQVFGCIANCYTLDYLALCCDILEEFVPGLVVYQWMSHSRVEVRGI